MVQVLPEVFRQLLISALPGKCNVIHGRCIKKLQEFKVLPDFRRILPLRKNPVHFREDGSSAHIFGDRDSLISLQYIESAHVLIDQDRVSDSLFILGLEQSLPLGGKLRIRLHRGHEVRGKCSLPSLCLCPDHQEERNLHHTDPDRIDAAIIGEDFIQRRKCIRFSRRSRIPNRLFSQFSRFSVIFCHTHSPVRTKEFPESFRDYRSKEGAACRSMFPTAAPSVQFTL